LIIDCYNMLHAVMPPELAGLDERGLCAALLRSGIARRGVTVVCDGAPKPHSPSPGETGDVTFIFSGARRSADAIIIELIEQSSAPRRLMVVSDDREIAAAARRRRAQAVATAAFIRSLAGAIEASGGAARGPEKPVHPLSDAQVSIWMRRFGYDVEDSSEKSWWERFEEELGEED
jgi:hypothetical protein